MAFDEITLPSGLRVIGEKIAHVRSVSVGIWVGAGSQHETPSENGLSHYLEHMLFKGTERRTARQIAEEMDAVGGQMNAFTSKECTCYYCKVVDEHLPLAIDVLSDMLIHSTFDPEELNKERGVILEEIAMAEDTPDDLVTELLMLAQYGDQPIARPILGTEQTVGGFTREDLIRYHHKMYRPENTVVALAGNYVWEDVLEQIQRHLGDWERGEFEKRIVTTDDVKPTVLRREKNIEQIHICLGYPGVTSDSDKVFALSIFNSVFGGAMSSRLFQKIREERGLAYSVYSYPNNYITCGMMAVYAGTNVESAPEVIRMIREEARQLAEQGMTEREFVQAREQLKSSYILGLESTSSRMNAIGRRKLIYGDTRTEDEVIARINAVTLEETNALMRELLTGEVAVSLVGKGAATLEWE